MLLGLYLKLGLHAIAVCLRRKTQTDIFRRCTPQEVYDLAWSPTGEYILSGSTDNTARIFSVADGKSGRIL